MAPKPFTIDVPQERLDWIRQRIADYEWFEEPVDSDRDGVWAYGANKSFMQDLARYWLDEYDWRKQEAAMNRFDHFTAPCEGRDGTIDIHFIHERGSNPDNLPVIVMHGWPGSYVEHLETIEPIAHPERFGGDAADGRDVIVPSLVGYGWSGKPKTPMGPRAMGAYMNDLMVNQLGYPCYVAQGGDWGGIMANWMGFDFGEDKGGPIKSIHVNLIGLRPTDENGQLPPETDEEITHAAEAADRFNGENGYFLVHSSKPQSLAMGMMDSPMGIAAWITEKFHTWSDRSGRGEVSGVLENTYSYDQLLNNIMVYIASRTFNTSTWNYYGAGLEGGFFMPPGEKVGVPTGVASFPREIAPVPPASYVKKGYNLVRYTEMPRGGHFGAMEQPEDFCAELAKFLKEWG